MTGRKNRNRQATQAMVCYSVLQNYLQEPKLQQACDALRYQMRRGPNAWAFQQIVDIPVGEFDRNGHAK